jgi:hypothetical protein
VDRLVQQPSPMHRTNLSKAEVSGSDAFCSKRIGRLLGSDDLLDSATELTFELMVEEPANTVLEACSSGAYPSLSDVDSESISDLDLVEELEAAALEIEPEPAQEAVVELPDEVLCEEQPVEAADAPAAAASETILFRCRPGETLPPGAVYAEELPRFAISSKRKALSRLWGCAYDVQRCVSPLPSFGLDELAYRKSRLPPPRLPKFIIE